jgi:hypothetical protein
VNIGDGWRKWRSSWIGCYLLLSCSASLPLLVLVQASSCGPLGDTTATQAEMTPAHDTPWALGRRSAFAYVPAPFAKFNRKFFGDGSGLFSCKEKAPPQERGPSGRLRTFPLGRSYQVSVRSKGMRALL